MVKGRGSPKVGLPEAETEGETDEELAGSG